MKRVFLAVSVVVLMAGCYNDKYDKLYPAPQSNVDLCDTATNPAKFSVSVNHILTSKCASTGCHDASTKQNGYNFSSYSVDSAASARILVRAFATSSPMPPTTSAQLSDCEKKQLAYWLNHGSLNN